MPPPRQPDKRRHPQTLRRHQQGRLQDGNARPAPTLQPVLHRRHDKQPLEPPRSANRTAPVPESQNNRLSTPQTARVAVSLPPRPEVTESPAKVYLMIQIQAAYLSIPHRCVWESRQKIAPHDRQCGHVHPELLGRQRLYRRVVNIRLDAAHKATTAIAKRSRQGRVESLHVAGWMGNRRLSRSTADASPGRFLTLLKWKCKREGVRLVEVDRFYPSSKTCSACGAVNGELRMEERWRCPACGASHNRDDNASVELAPPRACPGLDPGSGG